ncbi:hypothetical protein [Methanocalculus taiwanensis]|uniref:hypothetical protein n=1 Tax=Methanocalculus taiwanensis TaxID=106207 RepID=UPI002100862A|nr:hypothetical protein [Methanocalculus taiwanensis]
MGGRGGAPAFVAEELKTAGFTVAGTFEVQFVPDEGELDSAFDAGLTMAKRISSE